MLHDEILVYHLLFTFACVALVEIYCLCVQCSLRALLRSALKSRDLKSAVGFGQF